LQIFGVHLAFKNYSGEGTLWFHFNLGPTLIYFNIFVLHFVSVHCPDLILHNNKIVVIPNSDYSNIA